MQSDDALAQFERLDAALSAEGAVAVDICAIYRNVKGPAEAILPIIELIPVYGKTIASLIRTLLRIAAAACPNS